MSYQSAVWTPLNVIKKKVYPLFGGGYIDNCSNYDLLPNWSPYLRNARFDWIDLVIRPWHILHASLTAGSTPKGIGSYLRSVPANDVLVVRHNQSAGHKLVTITAAGSITSIDTWVLITSDNRMNFINSGDNVYCMNGVDKIGKLAWTTYSNPVSGTIGSAITPAFGVVFNSSLFVSGWWTNPNIVYKSVWNNFEDYDSTGSDKFNFEEPITGLATTNQALFYFTKNSVAVTATSDIVTTSGAVSYSNRALKVVEGAFNNECIVAVGNNVYYLNSAIQIDQIATGQNINGFEVKSLSQRPMAWCSKLLDSLDRDQTGSYGEYVAWPSLIKRHLKTNWASYPDIVLVYDTVKDKFLVDNNKYFFGWVDFHQYHYSISAVEPKVFKDEYGTDDDDSAIPFEFWSKEFYVTDATLKKVIWELRTLMDINELAVITQEVWLDWVLKDTKVIDKNSLPQLAVWGIWVNAVGTDPVGEDWINEDNSVIDDDYQELVILRTKGNLNYRFKKMQFRRYTSTKAAKLRLKTITAKTEQLDFLTTPLTPN